MITPTRQLLLSVIFYLMFEKWVTLPNSIFWKIINIVFPCFVFVGVKKIDQFCVFINFEIWMWRKPLRNCSSNFMISSKMKQYKQWFTKRCFCWKSDQKWLYQTVLHSQRVDEPMLEIDNFLKFVSTSKSCFFEHNNTENWILPSGKTQCSTKPNRVNLSFISFFSSSEWIKAPHTICNNRSFPALCQKWVTIFLRLLFTWKSYIQQRVRNMNKSIVMKLSCVKLLKWLFL